MPPDRKVAAGGILKILTMMKVIRYLLIFTCSIAYIFPLHAQKHDRYWPFGTAYSESNFKPVFFFLEFDYNGGYEVEVPPQPDSSKSKFLIFDSSPGTTSYSDKEGNLKFMSNSL
ncbi:MAG TPA: hypothetical protein PL173_13140, partial [Saprospiraceae bacterium]|nr:hypothetical protein [Saprospiraceae bacterium]HNE66713.1 hypothetical protein [Saprospiraceae bacterium]HNG14024.1 hypothetical protein [Saprospiraceae bacterium]